AVTMKMMSRTRMTSTSGVTLMSDSAGPKRPPRGPGAVMATDRPAGPGCVSEADLAGLGMGRGGPAGLDVRLGDRGEDQHEALDAAGETRRPRGAHVVPDARGDGRGQSCRGRHEGYRDAGRDGPQCRRAGDPDPLEGVHDPPHRPEQSDEGGDAAGGRED